jgi:uncharacterized protein
MTPYTSSRSRTQPIDRAESEAADGLWITYRWMTAGVALTALVAWLTASSPALLDIIFGNRIVYWGLFGVQILMVMTFSAVAVRASTLVAGAMFLAYAAISGLTLSAICLLYTGNSLALTFGVTAGAFGGLSLFGLFTKRDLSSVGRFAIFALFGLIIASLVNFFLQSPAMQWIISFVGVLIFGALTAYDTQKLRAMFLAGGGGGNLALRGALTLYLDFINMFLFLLRFFGNRSSRD